MSPSSENVDEAILESNLEPLGEPVEPIETPEILLAVENFSGLQVNRNPVPLDEAEAEAITTDLQLNSLILLRDQLQLSDTEIIDIFGSLESPEIALVGLTFTILENTDELEGMGGNICDQEDKYAKCIVETLLPCQALTAFYNLTDGRLSAAAIYAAWHSLSNVGQRALLEDIIKWGGKRLGYWALVVAIWDLSTCLLANNQDAYVRRDSTIAAEIIDFPSSGGWYYYTAYHSHIGPYTGSDMQNYVPKPTTEVFKDLQTNKYYMGPQLLTVIPDGFYIKTDDSLINSRMKYREVKEGVVIKMAYALNDPNRILERFYYSTYAPFFQE